MTLSEALNNYQNFLTARNFSLVYKNYMKLYLSWLEEKNIVLESCYKQETISLFFNETNYSANSKNSFLKAGRNYYTAFLGVAKEQNGFFQIWLMKTERKIPQYLTEDDLKKAIKYLTTYHSDFMLSTKMEMVLLFLFYTGLRKGELLHLKREDVNLEKNSLIVRVPNKGKTERTVFFPKDIKEKLSNYFLSEKEDNNALNIDLNKLNILVRLLSKQLNRRIYIHLFRHSYCRNLIEKGIPIEIAQKLLGHSSLQTTLLYADSDLPMIERVYKDKFKQ